MNIFNRIFKKDNNDISEKVEISQTPLFIQISPNQEEVLSYYKIIYIESQNHPFVNKYIDENLEELKNLFYQEGKDFIYLPSRKEMLMELIIYKYPEINQKELNEDTINLYIQELYNYFYQSTNNYVNKEIYCGLATYTTNNLKTVSFIYYPLPYDTEIEIELSRSFKTTLGRLNYKRPSRSEEEVPQYSLSDPWEESYLSGKYYEADEYFSRESKQLIKEVWEKIDQLKEMGVSHIILQKLLSLAAPRKLSRIVITPEFQIYLPDYNNIEITMSPLPKAVFLLFLKHPEGILFKKLHDFKPELKEIYEQISSREDMIKASRSINDLTDPTKNSINEKCSRIREAFVQHFDDDIAKYYYITGERSMPKKILIDRGLVEWI
jgi:hypothetical protein